MLEAEQETLKGNLYLLSRAGAQAQAHVAALKTNQTEQEQSVETASRQTASPTRQQPGTGSAKFEDQVTRPKHQTRTSTRTNRLTSRLTAEVVETGKYGPFG